jgi:2-iminobutanoate/2-iminopropanoate deaminase
MSFEYGPITSPEILQALGPYSQVVRAGNLLYVSGQVGLNPATGEPAGDSVEAQARQAFENLSTVLRAAGSDMQYVIKITVFLTDANAFSTLNELFREYFPKNPPARSVPIVQLPKGLRISIECVAVLPGES